MEKGIKWRWFLAAIPILIIFRIAGFVGNFWLGLGTVSIGVGVALLQMIPTAKLNILSKLFIVWTAIMIGLPLTKAALFENLPPRTKEATEQRGVWSDMQAAEKIRPHGLEGLAVFRRWSSHMEKKSAEYFQRKYEALQNDYWAGRITYDQMMTADKELRRQMEASINWRKEASNFIQGRQLSQEKSFFEKSSTWISNSRANKLFLLGLAGLTMLLFSIIPSPAKKYLARLGGLFLTAALILGALTFFWPDIKAGAKEIGFDDGRGNSGKITETTHGPRQECAQKKLMPGEVWSTGLYFKHGSQINYSQTGERFFIKNTTRPDTEITAPSFSTSGFNPGVVTVRNGNGTNTVTVTVN